MEFKKLLAFMALIFGLGSLEFMKKSIYLSIVFITIILIYLLNVIYETAKWIKNNRRLDYDYIKLSGGISIGDVASLTIVLFPLLNKLSGEEFNIFKEYKSIINSGSYVEYIHRFNGNEKFFLYAMVSIFIFAIINIIRGIFIIPKVCSDGFLDVDGKNIAFRDITSIHVKKTIWGFTRSIAVAIGKESKIFYVSNRSYDDFKSLIKLYYPNEISGDIEREESVLTYTIDK